VTIVKASPQFRPIPALPKSLHEPDKAAVWAFALKGTAVDAPRTADVVMLDGKHVIESVVDLQNKKSSPGRRLKTPTAWCCWMISPACRTSSTPARIRRVLKKHGITDPKSDHHPADRRLL
jgi:primary-amine oxidase